ncbi:hypothetical protein UA08_06646 [Talaromyces atroroseus]|uniref:AB hydrolase-1 domain-containing protein n=1 Tax=Talaromyces atroroseus TaxID=1441469 RepID=A0A225AWQ1_TALAT|nr:hypothetical protein UA08_06646 [Talaromyces atroroseus]OKL57927.1 hypothetical protein UA08_06646 [Talaromyces atroroseus]
MASKPDKINIHGDERVEWHSASLNGRRYAYLYGEPSSGKWKATVFLIHGFPDLAVGWRYQIPVLLELGFRIVAPDQLGYGRTEAPNDLEDYAFKKMASDFAQLVRKLGESQIVLCGHDWGAGLCYAIYHHQRALISHIITACAPYSPPRATYLSLDDIVANYLPNFAYQLQFRSGEIEKIVRTSGDIRQFLLSLYGGRTPKGEDGWEATKGVILDRLHSLGQSPLLNGEDLEFYVKEYSRNGIHSPLNWYRLTEINFNDAKPYASTPTIDVPMLFIQALKDSALPPSMSKSMGQWIPDLTIKQLNTSHWALTEDPRGVNESIGSWLEGQFAKKGSSL